MERNNRNLPDTRPEALADAPELALFVASLYTRLGGRLAIDPDGSRHTIRPARHDIWQDGIPQMENASEEERFQSPAEWEGAIRLAEYWLHRLGPSDRDYVFAAMAEADAGEEAGFDFREQLAGDQSQ
jgi:hypothetical protein